MIDSSDAICVVKSLGLIPKTQLSTRFLVLIGSTFI
jgi:hypothetical protein